MDDAFYTNFVRIEYRSARLVEAMRIEGRLQGNAVRARVRFYFDDAKRDLTKPQTLNEGDPLVRLYYCPWIDAYQMEMWGTLEVPSGDYHAPGRAHDDGAERRDHGVPQLQRFLDDVKRIREIDLEFLEDNVMTPSGYLLPDTATKTDDFYFRNLQVPNTQNPSDQGNTVAKASYTLNFDRGFFIPDASQVLPVRYRNAMMMQDNPDRGDGNVIEMRWLLQDEFGFRARVLPRGTIPPSTGRGHAPAHRQRGALLHHRGQWHRLHGRARQPRPRREGHLRCRPLSHRQAAPLRSRSQGRARAAGEEGIRDLHEERRNPRHPEPERHRTLKFVAFLYQSA